MLKEISIYGFSQLGDLRGVVDLGDLLGRTVDFDSQRPAQGHVGKREGGHLGMQVEYAVQTTMILRSKDLLAGALDRHRKRSAGVAAEVVHLNL
jgi:hypothetical protein